MKKTLYINSENGIYLENKKPIYSERFFIHKNVVTNNQHRSYLYDSST